MGNLCPLKFRSGVAREVGQYKSAVLQKPFSQSERNQLIELPSFVSNNGNLSNEEMEKLITTVIESVGG